MAEGIYVCYLRTEGLSRADLVPLVSPDDLRHANQFREEMRCIRSLASRALRRWGLNSFLGESDWSISLGEYGKPTLTGPGAFNTSSTLGLVAFAYTADGSIGIDIEAKVRCEALKMPLRELESWTEHEAVAKGIGTGVELALSGLKPLGRGIYQDAERNENWRAFKLELPDQWVGAVAVPIDHNWPVTLHETRLDELAGHQTLL